MKSNEKQTSIVEKINAIPKPQAKKFALKEVTIGITQNFPSWFTAIAMEINSPLYFAGHAEEVAAMFGRWLENTLNDMEINNVKKITIKVTR